MASVFLPASALVLLMLKLGKLPPRVFAAGLDISELTLSCFLFPKLKMLELLLLVLDVVLAAANVPPASVPPNKPPPVALVADDPLDSAAPFWEFVEFSSKKKLNCSNS